MAFGLVPFSNVSYKVLETILPGEFDYLVIIKLSILVKADYQKFLLVLHIYCQSISNWCFF